MTKICYLEWNCAGLLNFNTSRTKHNFDLVQISNLLIHLQESLFSKDMPSFCSLNSTMSYQQSSVQPKPCFGIGNRNQDQVSVSVSGPELFLPKPKLSRWYRYLASWMKNENITSLSCYKWSLEIISNCFITDWHDTYQWYTE